MAKEYTKERVLAFLNERKAKELLRLPRSWQPVCMLYVRYPAEDFTPNTHLGGCRKLLSETCLNMQKGCQGFLYGVLEGLR